MAAPQTASPVDSDQSPVGKDPLYRQLGPRIFFAGVVFAALSGSSTRRALTRRRAPIQAIAVQRQPPSIRAQLVRNQARSAQKQQPTTNSQLPRSAAQPAGQLVSQRTAKVSEEDAVIAANEAATELDRISEQQDPLGEGEEEAPDLKNSGPVMALEALALATMNVFSLAFVAVGAALWAYDINSLEDLRRKVRGGLGVDGSGRTEKEAEEEMEEWIVSVIARKEEKAKAAERSVSQSPPTNERGRPR